MTEMSEVGKGWRSFIKGRKFCGETGVAIVMFLLVVVLPRVWHSRCKIQTACDCRDFHSIRKEDRMLTHLGFSLGIPNSSLVRIYILLWTETLWNWCALLKDTPLSHVEFPFSKVSFFSKLYRGARFLFYCLCQLFCPTCLSQGARTIWTYYSRPLLCSSSLCCTRHWLLFSYSQAEVRKYVWKKKI